MNRPVGDAIPNDISERHDAPSDCVDIVDESSPVSVPLSLLILPQQQLAKDRRGKTKELLLTHYKS